MNYIASLKVLQNRKASFDSDSDMNKILGFAEKFADECGISRGRKKAYPHIDEMDNNVVVSFDTLYDTLPRGIELPDGKGNVTVIIYQNPLNKEYVVDMGIFTKGSMKPLSAKFILNQKDLENYEDFRRDFYNGLKETLEKLTERYTGKTPVKAVRNRKASAEDNLLPFVQRFVKEESRKEGPEWKNPRGGVDFSFDDRHYPRYVKRLDNYYLEGVECTITRYIEVSGYLLVDLSGWMSLILKITKSSGKN